MFTIVILLFFIQTSGTEPYFEYDTNIQDDFLMWPQAQVFIFKSKDFLYYDGSTMPDCFGTLISSKHVLTAASCVQNTNSMHRNINDFYVAKVRNVIKG